MDEAIDRALPPARRAAAMNVEPFVVRSPVARLVLLDDPEDFHQRRVLPYDRMAQQDFDLAMTPSLGQRDHPAQPLEQIIALDDAQRVEVVDRRTEHDGDEAVDVPAGATHGQRHDPAPLEPAAEHEIMLMLVRAVLANLGDEFCVLRPARAYRLQHAIQRRISAMLVVKVDGSEEIEAPQLKPSTHSTSPVRNCRGARIRLQSARVSALGPLCNRARSVWRAKLTP